MDIRAIHEQNRRDQVAKQRHDENQVANIQLQETVVKSFSSLVGYLDRKVSKTEVVNQLRSIGTPDALKVVASVDSLHETIKAQSGERPEIKVNIPELEQKDYTELISMLAETVRGVEQAVKEQTTTVQAPVVNIPETVVNVPETDLKPLERGLEKVEKAVKAVKIPKIPQTDTTGIEKRIDKSNKLLKEIVGKPVGGGGGGGGSWPAVNADEITHPLTVDSHGNLKIVDTPMAKKITAVGSITYIASATPGTAQAAAAWQVQKVDESIAGTTVITWADGNANFDNVATDLTALIYS